MEEYQIVISHHGDGRYAITALDKVTMQPSNIDTGVGDTGYDKEALIQVLRDKFHQNYNSIARILFDNR